MFWQSIGSSQREIEEAGNSTFQRFRSTDGRGNSSLSEQKPYGFKGATLVVYGALGAIILARYLELLKTSWPTTFLLGIGAGLVAAAVISTVRATRLGYIEVREVAMRARDAVSERAVIMRWMPLGP